jgi:hypothetical protein
MAEILLMADGIYRWNGPKRKTLLTSGTLGRLILTTENLYFLSTGSHDVTAGKVVRNLLGDVAGSMKVDDTDHLDLSALRKPGSIKVAADRFLGASLQRKGLAMYLSVRYENEAGGEEASAFAPKNTGMPDGDTWVEVIESIAAV